MSSLVKDGNDDLPYNIKSFLDEIGVRETIILTREETPRIEYDVWYHPIGVKSHHFKYQVCHMAMLN